MCAEAKPKALHMLGKNSNTEPLCFLVIKAGATGCFMNSCERVMSFEIIHALTHTFSHVYSASLCSKSWYQNGYRSEKGISLTVHGENAKKKNLHSTQRLTID